MEVSTINAAVFAKMFLAGAKNLEAKKEWINELNVFVQVLETISLAGLIFLQIMTKRSLQELRLLPRRLKKIPMYLS